MFTSYSSTLPFETRTRCFLIEALLIQARADGFVEALRGRVTDLGNLGD